MPYFKTTVLLCVFCILNIKAQAPKTWQSGDIYQAIQKLNVLASVLYVAAHPDDENTRLISYMANSVKARTAYLSLTRGDGGQNLIGPELRELLGVIRTQELLAARRVDGGEQLFTRANDFGYSKHPEETLKIWDKNKVLSDVVWAIRQFKPDIIINRFDHRTPGTTHGHHTSSAMLSLEAFDLANQNSAYNSQLQHTTTWQPKRLFFNTSWWFYGSQNAFENADKSNMLHFNIGEYYPLKGQSNNEIAALASSQHLCQGFGRLSQRGEQQEYIEFLKGNPLTTNNPFEGIDTSWNRVKGGNAIASILKPIEANFNFKNPAEHLPDLVKAYTLLQNIENTHWKTIKTKALLDIIEACAGLYVEVSSNTPSATPKDSVSLNFEVINRSRVDITLQAYQINTDNKTVTLQQQLQNNVKHNISKTIILPKNTPLTSPYWLSKQGSLGMYTANNPKLIGKPETPKSVNVTFYFNINNTSIPITKPVVYRYAKPDKGELYKPFEIVPPVSAKIKNEVIIFNTPKAKTIEVIVTAETDIVNATVQIAHPNGWLVSPKTQSITAIKKGQQQKVTFTITPPKHNAEGLLTPMVTYNNTTYTHKKELIQYAHIPQQTVFSPSQTKVVRLQIKTSGTNIGYIKGAGDAIPEGLEQIGYKVTFINPETIGPTTLSAFDAVVVGIRAYNIIDALKFKQIFLLDYVKNGGNIIIQYNTNRNIKVENIAPYHLKLSRDRVTNENAEIRILKPKHSLLNYPNTITSADFNNWVQERGLYFPNQWDSKFTPLFELNDTNETPKQGSLLIARYGKGNYIYTGLSFFRQFPAGVPGAFRLFANLLSAKSH